MAEVQVSKINQEELIKKVDDLEKRLQTKDAEIQVYKMLISQMEEDASQAKKYKALHEKQTQDVDLLRTESEKTLTKAKSMIFEKTKVIKNQELQIEAFTQQIESLKEVVRITKDLLGIRNLEVQQLEIKISSMEGKQKAEKERYDLMHKKLEMMIRHNGELKREYETQLCLFTALRDRYNERELAKGVVDNLKKGDNAMSKEVEKQEVNNLVVANATNNNDSSGNITNDDNNIDINNQDLMTEENKTENKVTVVPNQQIPTFDSNFNTDPNNVVINNEINTDIESSSPNKENTEVQQPNEVKEVKVELSNEVTETKDQQSNNEVTETKDQQSNNEVTETKDQQSNKITECKDQQSNEITEIKIQQPKGVAEVKTQQSSEATTGGQIDPVSENLVQKKE